MLYAAEHAAQVLQVCLATPPSDGGTVRALVDAFDLTEFQAEVILGMPMRRFSPASVAVIRSELVEIEGMIEQLRHRN